MFKIVALASSLATSYADINETITITERIIIEHCMNRKEDCSKEAQADAELVKQLEGVY